MGFLLPFLSLFLSMFYTGVILYSFWGWFISSQFNIVAISFPQALGIGLLIGYLTSAEKTKDIQWHEETSDSTMMRLMKKKALVDLFAVVIVYAIGYGIKMQM